MTVTRNEILTALNTPGDIVLALVEVDGDSAILRSVRRPFQTEPDFGAASLNYKLKTPMEMPKTRYEGGSIGAAHDSDRRCHCKAVPDLLTLL